MNVIKRDIGLMCAAQKLLNFFCIMKTALTVATIAFSVLESVNMLKNLKIRAQSRKPAGGNHTAHGLLFCTSSNILF